MGARQNDACRGGALALAGLLAALLAGREAFAQAASPGAASPRTRTVIGWIETVAIEPGDLRIRAKLDTGARTSSLNAPDFRLFERAGERWVSFTVTNREGKAVTLERKVVRSARIKRIQGPSQIRPVVRLTLCIGSVQAETEVNLVNRTGFNYEMLIGRRFLARRFAIDPARTLTVEPACPGAAR